MGGIPFTITVDDVPVPDKCPVLGIDMKRGADGQNSPSIDRKIGALGYVPGNVCVISARANRIKNDATLAELEALVSWMRSFSVGN
jgi:hypothetical protein